MARLNQYDFKCAECGGIVEAFQEAQKVVEGWVPYCPRCDTQEHMKRVWAFGQFTFKGGLPSNHGRDPMKVWR